MLDQEVITKIETFVHETPRTVQEVAQYLDRNWRTADRYIEDIHTNYGTINTRTFREGTRGALKIVYWAGVERVSKSVFQKDFEYDIYAGKRKEDFLPFDIFQHVPDDKKYVRTNTFGKEAIERAEQYIKEITSAKKQLLLFSGNLSLINAESDIILRALDELVQKGIQIKVLCRVDVESRENVKKLLALNHKYGKELVEVHHRAHPLRGTIIDSKLFNIKEVRKPSKKENELANILEIYYGITDKNWIEWLQKIFWNMWSKSIDAKKRIIELDKIEIPF
jgi:hypothetical protein